MSPEAVQHRQESRTAFAGTTPAEAEALLSETFSDQLRNLNADPARYLSDAQLLSPSEDETAGTVKEDGDSMVLDAAIPLRTDNEEGELRKVDLTLEASPGGFETTNAIVDVSIPDSAADSILVGDEDLEISQEGATPERDARRFGDENIFYPNVLPDTDMLVSPVAGGVEIFNQLRSEQSPETFRFQIDVPEGATLRTSGDWGAEVVSEDRTIAKIPEPVAVDAQGSDVPVDLQVEGKDLLLTVNHREGDYAMPILLDPILENNENWIYGQNHNALDMGMWNYTNNDSWWFKGSTKCIYECFGPGGQGTRGLYVSLEGQRSYGAEQFGHWSYSAPNIYSYISSVTLGAPYVMEDHGCSESQYPKPHNYFGVWSNSGFWVYRSVGSANQPGGTYTLPFSGDSVIFGLGTGPNGIPWIPCWRDLYAGGAHVWLDDWGRPYIEGGQQGIKGIPSGWVSNETPFTITAQAKDEGLGIKNVRIHQWGGETIYDIPPQNECAGTRRSPCLTTHTASFDNLHGGYFFEGERDVWLSANDPTGEYSDDHHWTMRIDNTPPTMNLKGQFAEATSEVGNQEVPAGKGDQLSLPVYKLEIEAKDGSWDNPLNKRSGVKDIEIYLDGVEQSVPWISQPCSGPNYSCEMKKTYSVQLSKLTTSGKHVLKVEAVDQVGKRLKRELEFEYFPATGMKDEYAMHFFPLPDGIGNESEEEHPDRPELAVNVMNGNLVYRETDIDIESPAALDLEVERYYSSMLPENEDTEWGDGWTLAQTPELDPIKVEGSPVPNQAEVLDSSGAIEDDVRLPTEVGAEKFDPALQATVTKKPSGGYELSDETGESTTSVAFDATGQTEALLSESYAKVDYDYQGGALAGIEVSDPATFAADPSELEIPEPGLITAPTYADSFGSIGTGDGQLKSPGGLAVDPQGNLWVVDKANNRIQKFDSTGKFLAKSGSLGSGDGQFNRPTAIAIAANGDLLVTDAGNSRVQRFNSAGAFLSKFGTKGTGSGQFAGSGPEGIAIDTAGNIWVSDTYGGRIQKFSAAGAFLQSVGTKGSGAGQLGQPTGLDIDSSGKIWVADYQNQRVTIFSAAGEFVSSFGSFGAGDGQFKNPDAIEIDKLGNVWVGDQANHRIQQFDVSGQQFKGKFGSPGSGPGQFSFSYPMSIAADSKGNLWITDVNNHRIHHWLVPVERPAYVHSFGSAGSGNGQLSLPGGLAVGVEGNLLVVDKSNNRIQRFDKSGNYLGQFGSFGTGNGQFNRPTSIAVDRDGNLLVADSNNNRIQKFGPQGEFILKFGATGAGNGQFSSPEGVTTDVDGTIWVADSGNGRIQKFSEEGEFLGVVSSKGSNPGHLGKPIGIDVDSEGRIWVGDFQNHRVSVFEADGDFVGQIGELGTAPGRFAVPTSVEIDAHDNVWVADQANSRIQRFDLSGVYIGQFGSKGTGSGQFQFPGGSAPVGIASDRRGAIWVSDVNSNRIQRWMLGHYEAEAPAELDLSDGDPRVEVATAGGLVTSVSGNAAGEHTYEHEGDFLTSHAGPEGETLYEKNAAGLLSKVTLPNGTWATIAYFADNRVQSVTVAPNGANAKTTNFHYEDGPPRRSIVTPPNQPQITYDIGSDGSVLKWWHKDSPPEIISLNGSLGFDKGGKEVAAGDLVLEVVGDSAHGVSSIQIIANGNELVSEKTCEQDPDPDIECTRLEDLWVTDTASLAPGVLNIEVIVTNELEKSDSRRWSVTIPRTPPPVPGYPVPPKFSEIEKFREDYGLEVVFPVANERELVERIFNLINAWHSPHTPAGEVARASMERWGVPLRPEDVAELEYRERYVEHNGPVIQEWGESNHPNSYAGYWVDHRSGGLMRVGFVGGSSGPLGQIKADPRIEAPERADAFGKDPSKAISELVSLQAAIAANHASEAPLQGLITRVGLDIAANKVTVGSSNVAAVSEGLIGAYGASAPFEVHYEASMGGPQSRRWENEGPIYGGQMIVRQTAVTPEDRYALCSAGFGAKEKMGLLPNGQAKTASFILTSGHCFKEGQVVQRVAEAPDGDLHSPVRIGEQRGRLWRIYQDGNTKFESDGAAVRLDSPLATNSVLATDGKLARVDGVSVPVLGQSLCVSLGRTNAVRCQPLKEPAFVMHGAGYQEEGAFPGAGPFWQLGLLISSQKGDSGSPVWSPRTDKAVGIQVFGPPAQFTPLLPPPLPEKGPYPYLEPKRSDAMGLLNEPFMGDDLFILGQ